MLVRVCNSYLSKILLAVIILLVGNSYAFAQNNSVNPYIDSWHKYQVPMGDNGNTVVWTIKNANYNSGVPISLNTTLDWVQNITKAENATKDTAYIEIKFVSDIFKDITGPWTLIYSEQNDAEGACSALRSLDITPVDNEFYLTVGDDGSDCNSFAGSVWDNTQNITDDTTMQVIFEVAMAKNINHLVSEWRFDAVISGTDFSIPTTTIAEFMPVTTGSSTFGTYSIADVDAGTGTFSVSVSPDTSNSAYTVADTVLFPINIIGDPTKDIAISLTISNGEGISGDNYKVITDDNGSSDTDGHVQKLVLFGIPATSPITVVP